MNRLKNAYTIIEHTFDVVVIGAGGSGLRCAYECAKNGLNTAVVTKKSYCCCPRRNKCCFR